MKEEKTKKWWELVPVDIVQVSEQRKNSEDDGSQDLGIWIGKFTGIGKDGFPTGLVLDMYQCNNDYAILKKHKKAKKLYGNRFKLVRY